MNTLRLTKADNIAVNELLGDLTRQYASPCDESFLARARALAVQLPAPILIGLNEFRYRDDHNGALLIKGFGIDDDLLGNTPQTTSKELDETSAAREGFMLMLLVSLMGEPFGWSTQREGALINNVLPVKSHEGEQLSTGSTIDLDWHTEEAFHPFRADYLVLMCLRNPDGVPTILGSIQDVRLEAPVKKALFGPRYIFHTDKNFQNGLFDFEEPVPVLFGDYDSPYVRIDPSFMNAVVGDSDAEAALGNITASFKNALQEVVLEQGDILFMDNFRVVHGRKAFQPRFDGTDRWLKRVNITADLRKSRVLRPSHTSRIIQTS